MEYTGGAARVAASLHKERAANETYSTLVSSIALNVLQKLQDIITTSGKETPVATASGAILSRTTSIHEIYPIPVKTDCEEIEGSTEWMAEQSKVINKIILLITDVLQKADSTFDPKSSLTLHGFEYHNHDPKNIDFMLIVDPNKKGNLAKFASTLEIAIKYLSS